jgi:2-keto-4-pentenoate hydratase/2-oxohepta-3-ene-1,7-dioic acid hydratase in catechol pathway
MRLVTFTRPGGAAAVGALAGDQIVDLSAADPEFSSMTALIAAGPRVWKLAESATASATGPVLPVEGTRLLAPVPRPRKNVFCVGLNFRSHVEQNAIALGLPIEIPEVPLFFTKPPTAVVGPGGQIRRDRRLTSKLDWEVELAVVIGRGGTWISPDDADRHIFGYTLLNDVSARDLQWRTSQFFYGKGQDTYCPLGPAIVTAGELPPLDQVRLELYVNGELKQAEAAGNMLFPPSVAIAELSKGITLEPGDVISLGTPGGCGYQTVPEQYLVPGDVVECRATGIGSLTNVVVEWPESKHGEGRI